MSQEKIYQKTLEAQGIPPELAKECAKILVKDDKEPRTSEEQKTISKAHKLIK